MPSKQPKKTSVKHYNADIMDFLSPLDVRQAAEADDDITVAGSNASLRGSPAIDRSPKEMVLKLEFASKEARHPVALAGSANKILHRMYSSFFNQLNIFDNRGSKVKRFDVSEETFLKQFDLHSKFYAKNNNKYRYFFVFRIETKVTLGQIRKEIAVSEVLKEHSARLFFHPWTEDVTDVINLGWFMGPLPKYTMSDEINIRVANFLAFHASIDVKRIPKFHCQMDSISATYKGRKIACQAYSLTVQRQHSAALQKVILAAANKNTNPELLFIFHRQRYQHPEAFAKAVLQQNAREDSKRIVVVKGLDPDHMFEFDLRLKETYPDIEDIFITPTTSGKNPAGRPIGRYNLLCDKEKFVSLARRLYNELDSFYNEYLIHKGLESTAVDETVGVVSKFPGKHQDGLASDISESTINTRDSYMSSCASLLDTMDLPDFPDDIVPPFPEPDSSPSPSTSGQAPNSSSSTGVFSPTTSERTYAQVVATPTRRTTVQPNTVQHQQEMDSLKSEVAELKQTIANLSHVLQRFLSASDCPGPAPSPQRKKTRTSSHDGGPSAKADGTSETNMNHESS